MTQLPFSMPAWEAVNSLVAKLKDSEVVVSLSGLQRHWHEAELKWDSTNAEGFIRHNKQKGEYR